MSHVQISHWNAIELFCRVVCKYEKQGEIADFQKNGRLKTALDNYKHVTECERVTREIFGYKTSDKGRDAAKRTKSFYEFGRKIRYSFPVVMEGEELTGYLKYVNLTETQIHKKKLEEWEPSDKQRLFEGTTWLLYYFHRGDKNDGPESRGEVGSVARAVLRFHPFAKAEIIGFEEDECYEGTFEMYDKEEKFISFEMKMKTVHKKDLRMLIYIGNGIPKLALGQFRNVGEGIYSGTIMMESVPAEKAKDAEAGYFDQNGFKDLPEHVKKYFSDKKNNMLRVPLGISSLSQFEKWHARKNGK